jgi:hypothetical protein
LPAAWRRVSLAARILAVAAGDWRTALSSAARGLTEETPAPADLAGLLLAEARLS